MTDAVGSQAYVAPEVYAAAAGRSGQTYGPQCDLWSCGVILYIMLKGSFPFASRADAVASIMEDRTCGGVSEEAQEVVHGLLTVDVKKRMTAEQVLNHPWMCKTPKKALKRAQKGLQKFTTAMALRRYVRNTVASELVSRNAAVFGDEIKQEYARLKDGFVQLDKDGSGKVELRELVEVLGEMGYRLDPREVKTMFTYIDLDNCGLVTFKDFVGVCVTRAVVMNNNVLHRVFASIDVQKKGTLAIEDFQTAFPKLPPDKVQEMYEKMDLNKDGIIEYDEFKKSLMEKQLIDDDEFFCARKRLRGIMRLCTGVW